MRKFRVIPKYSCLTKKERVRARSEIGKKYKQKIAELKDTMAARDILGPLDNHSQTARDGIPQTHFTRSERPVETQIWGKKNLT